MRHIRKGRSAALTVAVLAAVAGTSALTGCGQQSGPAEGGVIVKVDGASRYENSGASIAAKGKKVEVQVNKSNATVTCTGGEEVDLLGSESTITLKGTCGHVELSGVSHRLKAETISGIRLTGTDTKIDVDTIEKDVVLIGTTSELVYGAYKGSGDPVMIGSELAQGPRGGALSTSTPTPAPVK